MGCFGVNFSRLIMGFCELIGLVLWAGGCCFVGHGSIDVWCFGSLILIECLSLLGLVGFLSVRWIVEMLGVFGRVVLGLILVLGVLQLRKLVRLVCWSCFDKLRLE
jgi:hypothetical protein